MSKPERISTKPLLVVLWNTGDAAENSVTLSSLCRERAPLLLASSIPKKNECEIRYVNAANVMEEEWDRCFFLRSGDTLAEGSLGMIEKIAEEKQADLLYTDECVNNDGNREYLWKPDFSADLLRSENYIGPRVVISRALIMKTGLRLGADTPDYNWILYLTEQAKTVVHIPETLVYAGSRVQESANKEMEALRAHLERIGLRGRVEPGKVDGTYHIRYEIEGAPLVSILIPNWEHAEDLMTCVESIREKTTWPAWEIVIVENNSIQDTTFRTYSELLRDERIHLVHYTGGFNYPAIMNFGVRYCRGDYVLQLNNDTKVISPDWIEEMLMLAQRNDVGAVGAMLYYPDDTVQHAGAVMIWLDREKLPAVPHAYMGWARGEAGELNRMAVVQNYSIVTGACLMVRKRVWQEMDGMDEKFAVAYNDVDFCLRLLDAGYVNTWTPYAELYHMESKSRTIDLSEEQKMVNAVEVQRFQSLHEKRIREGDPYVNPNSDKSIKLQGIRPRASEPVLYVPGTELDFFRSRNSAVFYQLDGFWEPEKTHTWTVGYTALLQFKLAWWNRDMELRFVAFPFNGSQRVGISVNGQELGQIQVQKEGQYCIRIPRTILREIIKVELTLPDARSPEEAGKGKDKRCLGVAMKTMTISDWNGAQDSCSAPIEREKLVEKKELSLIYSRIRSGDEAVHDGDRREVTLGIADLRKNLLRWYPFREGTEIMELFGGYGAMTELLLEKAARLTVFEPDAEKAKFLCERFKDHSNVKVINTLSGFTEGQQFDYIIRIETELDSREDVSSASGVDWKAFLKPEGRLLWAVRNRLSVETFASGNSSVLAAEDNVCGEILNTYRPSDRKTLEHVCARNGLEILRWFYPFPDQCFTYEVFTDKSLTQRRPETDAFPTEVPEMRLFDARQVQEALWDEGLSGVFCPAYLMEIGIKGSVPETKGMDYIRISANRSSAFSVFTFIDYERETVTKKACCPAGMEHIRRIRENSWQKGCMYSVPVSGVDSVDCAFLSGESLLERMREFSAAGDSYAFWACIMQLRSLLYADAASIMEETDDFRRVFGNTACRTPMHWVSRISIDLVPNNIFPVEEKWMVIDNEWIFDFPIPAEFILWRSCLYMFSQNEFGKMLEGHDLKEFLGVDENTVRIFEDWEKHFQIDYVQIHPVPIKQVVSVRLEELERTTEITAMLEDKRKQMRKSGQQLVEVSDSWAYRIGNLVSSVKGRLKGRKTRDALLELGQRLKNI